MRRSRLPRSISLARPEEPRPIAILRILNDAGSFGSVDISLQRPRPSNLFAATIVRREGQPIDFHFDADLSEVRITRLAASKGCGGYPPRASTDYLILSNPSKKPVAGSSGAFSDLGKSTHPGQHRPGRNEAYRSPRDARTGERRSHGRPHAFAAGQESLSATQIVFDEVTGLAAIMKLFDREPDDQSRTH